MLLDQVEEPEDSPRETSACHFSIRALSAGMDRSSTLASVSSSPTSSRIENSMSTGSLVRMRRRTPALIWSRRGSVISTPAGLVQWNFSVTAVVLFWGREELRGCEARAPAGLRARPDGADCQQPDASAVIYDWKLYQAAESSSRPNVPG